MMQDLGFHPSATQPLIYRKASTGVSGRMKKDKGNLFIVQPLSMRSSRKNEDLRRREKTASYSIICIFLLNNRDIEN